MDSPWAIATQASFSPTHSWTDSPGGSSASSKNIPVISPVWNFGRHTGVPFSFQHIYDLENTWDSGYVEYSADGGSGWTAAAGHTGTGCLAPSGRGFAVPECRG